MVKPIIARGISRKMMTGLSVVLAALALSVSGRAEQAPAPIDTARLGPQAGAVAPAFAGVDQFGKPHTLASISGPKGAMLVFFRSADW